MESLDKFKIGHVMAVKYERFNLFSEAIYRKQKAMEFSEEHSRYTHVAILSGGPYCVNIMPPRARFIEIPKVYKGAYVKLLRYKGNDFDNHIRYKIGCFYNAIAANLRYDWLGVLSFVIPGMGNFKSRPFCSEAATQAYQHFYPTMFNNTPPYKICPAHFVWYKDFEVYWEGRI